MFCLGLRDAAAAQIARTVYWDRCIDTLAERSVDEFRTPERAAGWVLNVIERR